MTLSDICKSVASLALVAASLAGSGARAQDIPGIEICTAEKTMERRTGCLQSNINYLKSALTKAELDAQRKLDAAVRRIEAAAREIEALKADITALRQSLDQIKAESKAKEPAAK